MVSKLGGRVVIVRRRRAALLGASALIGLAGVRTAAAEAASAVEQPAAAPGEVGSVEELVVTGTRFSGRIAAESPTPVDSISLETLAKGGRTDLTSMLKVAAPSLNTPRPVGSSFADFALPVTLRGLSPGQVLVLVDGKRRHTIGELNQTNSLGRGDVTYDLNAIPPAAIERIEVLRDGAGAQYGSDAIAGVVNLVLEDDPGATARALVGSTTEGDGDVLDLSASYGAEIGNGGTLRVSFQYVDQEEVNRARPDTRQQYLGSNGTRAPSAFFGSGVGLTPSSGAPDPREQTIDRDVFRLGESAFERKSVLANVDLPVAPGVELYGFGAYSRLDGVSEAFFRRSGQDENVRALYPDGYRPATEVVFNDYTVSAGLRGGDLARLRWDLSTTYGGVETRGTAINSVNPSFGAASPRSFDRGATENRHWTTNLDLARTFDLGLEAPTKVAVGLEHREEFYDLIAGERTSYAGGGSPILDGPNAGRPAPVGAQPVPGASDLGAVETGRSSNAAYVEVEQDLFDRLTLVGALRYEDFSDFGETTDYKLAGRLRLTDVLSVRANFGTGFRAPALAHSFYNSTLTSFAGGQQVLVRVFRVGEPAAALVGAQPLRPETSQSLSVGGVLALPRFTASVDAYRIEVDDRIVISSQFEGPAVAALLAGNGFPGVNAASYLTNAVDSVTEGVDVAVEYRAGLGSYGSLTTTLAANYNQSELTRIAGTPPPLAALGVRTPLFDLTQQVRFTDSQPRSKASLSVAWERDRLGLRLTGTRYGEVSAVALTNRTPAQITALTPGYDVDLVPVSAGSANADVVQTFAAEVLTDLEATYRLSDAVTLSAGVNNLFDVYPTENIRSTAAGVAAGSNGSDNAGTIPYNSISPFGFSGRYVFASLGVSF